MHYLFKEASNYDSGFLLDQLSKENGNTQAISAFNSTCHLPIKHVFKSYIYCIDFNNSNNKIINV